MNEKKLKPHIGVYGIFIVDNQVLLIKKARGPYTGLYDLPGGGIEFGERIETALYREILEEAGLAMISNQFMGYNEYFCKYINDGVKKDFHHIGLYYIVGLNSVEIKVSPDGHDSLGCEFVDMDLLKKENVAPIAWPMIQQAWRTLRKKRRKHRS
jgi:ADP-ribose pyrophosphatase YjhB (NUDIX family)